MSHQPTHPVRETNNVKWNELPAIDTTPAFEPFVTVLPSDELAESASLLSPTRAHPSISRNGAVPRKPSLHDSAARSLRAEQDHVDFASEPSPQDQHYQEGQIRSHDSRGTAISSHERRPQKSRATWLPYTLRPLYLGMLAVVSLILSITLAVLCWYSKQHQGLGRDDGSMGLFVGWRYIPTIIAVVFAQAMVVLVEDIKRTESFARLAAKTPVTAKYTLLWVPRIWWRALVDGFSTKKNAGRINWMLIISSLAVGISLLVISPLSSSMFVTKEIVVLNSVEMQRYAFDQNKAMRLSPQRETYLHSISGFLYNTSTSEWVSDTHIVFPFMPPQTVNVSSSYHQGFWQANTTVMQLESNCTPMSITEKTGFNVTYLFGIGQLVTPQIRKNMSSETSMFCSDVEKLRLLDTTPNNSSNTTNARQRSLIYCKQPYTRWTTGMKLGSSDGCTVQVQSPFVYDWMQQPDSLELLQMDMMTRIGGALWTNLSTSYTSWRQLTAKVGDPPLLKAKMDLQTDWDEWAYAPSYIFDLTDQCRGRDLVLVTTPWYDNWRNSSKLGFSSNFSAHAEVCTPVYYAATMPATLSSSNGKANVSFDTAEFLRRRAPIGDGVFDIDMLNYFAFREAWQQYTSASEDAELSGLRGAARVLSELFQKTSVGNEPVKDRTRMLSNTTVSSQSARLRSRFFGELMLSSLSGPGSTTENVSGHQVMIQQRIVVTSEIAITLAVLFFLLTCYLIALFFFASLHRRPLGLSIDPATTLGTGSLLYAKSPLAKTLRTMRSGRSLGDWGAVKSRYYALHDGTISEENSTETTVTELNPAKKMRSDWRPATLHKKWLIAYGFCLIAVAVALLVLRQLASDKRLTQSFFIYEVEWNIVQASFYPASIIATFFAVCISLYWGAIDSPMRILQPYLAMCKKGARIAQGVNLSYHSAYWAWAAVKAALQRHWLLFLVTVGTTLCQILVISMAAVFETQDTFQNQSMSIDRTWSNRHQPFQYRANITTWFYLDENVLKTTESDWLVSALNEITLDSAPPPWVKDGWAFTPIDLQQVKDSIDDEASKTPRSGLVSSTANVSFRTTALRSRIECTPIRLPKSTWTYSIRDLYESSRIGNLTGLIMPSRFNATEPKNIPIFSAPRQFACCANQTTGGQSVIAYWSSNNSFIDEEQPWPAYPKSTPWLRNFIVKWIVGPSKTIEVSGQQDPSNPFISVLADGTRNGGNVTLLYYEKQPEIQMMNCNPTIEVANADITIARASGQVLESKILDTPSPAMGAWERAYDMSSVACGSKGCWNATGVVSYGHYFLGQMLTAAHIVQPPFENSDIIQQKWLENINNERFNIRDKENGVNMDYMSYASYVLAKKDPTAMLNPETLQKHSQRVYQTFFTHFITSGKWRDQRAAYEKVDSSRPEKLDITLSTRIRVLGMNQTATWLSLTIVFLLLIILVILIISLELVYPRSSMQRNITCIADVLLMVAGSDYLLDLIHRSDREELKSSDVKTRLGWFKDQRGVARWGIEVEDMVEWVGDEWIDGMEDVKMQEIREGKRPVVMETELSRMLSRSGREL